MSAWKTASEQPAIFCARAYESGVAREPIRSLVDDENLATAYQVQDYNDKQWQAQGRRRVGRKLALTNKAVQQQFGISQACHGTLCRYGADRRCGDRPTRTERSARRDGNRRGAEKDLTHSQHTVLDIIDACDYLLAAFEIVDSRMIDWNVNACDFVADNTSASPGGARHQTGVPECV
ncbi:hypothetical protein CWS02_21030 [Enterobacter sp. EA-1]|nr:hypothetical protein CWS02_21030 [Enterobacter sp. EA-1]